MNVSHINNKFENKEQDREGYWSSLANMGRGRRGSRLKDHFVGMLLKKVDSDFPISWGGVTERKSNYFRRVDPCLHHAHSKRRGLLEFSQDFKPRGNLEI